jgi:hypothetical protein
MKDIVPFILVVLPLAIISVGMALTVVKAIWKSV